MFKISFRTQILDDRSLLFSCILLRSALASVDRKCLVTSHSGCRDHKQSYITSLSPKAKTTLIKCKRPRPCQCTCLCCVVCVAFDSLRTCHHVLNQHKQWLERTLTRVCHRLLPPGCTGSRSTPWPTSCSCKRPPASRAPSRPFARASGTEEEDDEEEEEEEVEEDSSREKTGRIIIRRGEGSPAFNKALQMPPPHPEDCIILV